MTKFLLVLVWLNGDPVLETERFGQYGDCLHRREFLLTELTEERRIVLVAECFHVAPSWRL